MALLINGEAVRPYPRDMRVLTSASGQRIRSIEDGMFGMGHWEAAGNFDADHAEIHAAMTAARAFRDNSQAFVNL